jgi:N-acetyl-anhydromuramyl-L-alanine amidase AmpD
MKVSPQRLEKFLKKWNVRTKYVRGWDAADIDPYKGKSDFIGVVLHHTAGTNSERYICFTNKYAPVRAAHFLVNRDGSVSVCSGVGAYHAGEGGPWKFTKTDVVPANGGNSRLYGIEIESLGTSAAISGTTKGMTVEQVVSTALLCGALLEAMSPVPGVVYKAGRVIRHKDWAPKRKIDVRQDLDWWRAVINIARANRKSSVVVDQKIREFVSAHPKGRL